MADSDHRHLPASERKIRRARQEGQVARSRDLSHLLAVGLGGALLVAALPWALEWLRRLMARGLIFDARTLAEPAELTQRLAELTAAAAWFVLPLGGVLVLLAVAAGVASGGWNFTFQPLWPKLNKLNPLTGLQQMFSLRRLADLGKATLLALVLGVVGGLWLWRRLPEFHDVLREPLPQALAHTGALLQAGLTLLVLALLVAALIDVPFQRHALAKQLRMSAAEAKQEHKETEGSPEVKGRIRQRMREAARRRMMAAVPSADLVVMNPSHYAVALKYEEARMAAPIVVAKGADLVAVRIRDLAQAHQVPVLQAPPLARALYAHCELEQQVPQRLFTAVAQVLAYVFRLRQAMRGQGPWPEAPGDLDVPPDLDPQAQASGAAAAAA